MTQSWVDREPLSGGGSIVRFGGELDLASAGLLSDALDEAAEAGGPIVVDLGQCEFIDSTGLAALMRAARDGNGSRPRLGVSGPTAQVRRLFEVTQIASQLPVFETSEEAAAALSHDSDS